MLLELLLELSELELDRLELTEDWLVALESEELLDPEDALDDESNS